MTGEGALVDPTTGRYDPLLHLAADHFAGTFLRFTEFDEPGRWGLTTFNQSGTRTVSLSRGLSAAEQRSTLAHEIVHLERGAPMSAHRKMEEAIVDLVAASRLVPADVIDSLACDDTSDNRVVGHELGVDAGTVEAARALAAAARALIAQRAAA